MWRGATAQYQLLCSLVFSAPISQILGGPSVGGALNITGIMLSYIVAWPKWRVRRGAASGLPQPPQYLLWLMPFFVVSCSPQSWTSRSRLPFSRSQKCASHPCLLDLSCFDPSSPYLPCASHYSFWLYELLAGGFYSNTPIPQFSTAISIPFHHDSLSPHSLLLPLLFGTWLLSLLTLLPGTLTRIFPSFSDLVECERRMWLIFTERENPFLFAKTKKSIVCLLGCSCLYYVRGKTWYAEYSASP